MAKTTGRLGSVDDLQGLDKMTPVAYLKKAISRLVRAVFILNLLLTTGCSRTSGPTPVIPMPHPDSLNIVGVIDLENVAVHPSLGGFRPSVRHSLLDHSHFLCTVEDDPSVKKMVGQDGFFKLEPLSPRDQIVLRFSNQRYPGFVIEYMEADSAGVFGDYVRATGGFELSARVTIFSTARSFIARALRNHYGRRISPKAIDDTIIGETVEAIAEVLEKHPERLSAATPLDQVAQVVEAYNNAAKQLHESGIGDYPRNWTLMVYQGGDNDIDLALQSDIKSMLKVGPPDKTALILQTDSTIKGLRRLRIEKDKETEFVRLTQADSADPSYIADFVGWCRRVFPARRFALIIASHGSGWRGSGSTRAGIIQDAGHNTSMNLLQLQDGLKFGLTHQGNLLRPLDLLAFDACLMGLFETAYQFREVTRFTVFSQGNIPSLGLDYESILSELPGNDESFDGEAFGRLICRTYTAWYDASGLSSRYSGTLSLIDSSRLQPLADALNDWIAALIQNAQTYIVPFIGIRDSIREDHSAYQGAERFVVQAFDHTDHRDLSDLLNAARSVTPNAAMAAERVQTALFNAVKTKTRFGDKYKRAGGISISLPGPTSYIDHESIPYSMLDSSQDTRWPEWLKYLSSAGTISKVHSRFARVEIEWNTDADIDLYIGEPDPSNPASGGLIWNSAAHGLITSNGAFSNDSAKTGLSLEHWVANDFVIPGSYYISVRNFRQGKANDPPTVKLRITAAGATATSLERVVSVDNRWGAAKISVGQNHITIEEIVEPIPEDDL